MEKEKKEKKSSKKLIIILSIIGVIAIGTLVTLLIIMNSGYDEDDEPSNSNYNNGTSGEPSKKKTKKELTESEKMIVSLSNLMDENLVFDTGSYIEGEIPAGEYAFVKFGDAGSYYEEEDSAGNILDNENFDSFGYVKVHGVGDIETRGVLISISAFEKLGVSGAKEIYEILNEKTDWNQAGYYKVGTDIEAGDYVVESIGSEGYYSVNSGPVGGGKIAKNDFVDGKASVKLKNGQYIELSRLKITKK